MGGGADVEVGPQLSGIDPALQYEGEHAARLPECRLGGATIRDQLALSVFGRHGADEGHSPFVRQAFPQPSVRSSATLTRLSSTLRVKPAFR